MTVQELIAYLEKLPKDAVIGVVYQAFSDYSVLEEKELLFFPKGESEHKQLYRRYILRNGQIMEFDSKTWDLSEGVPNFVDLLVLPGN